MVAKDDRDTVGGPELGSVLWQGNAVNESRVLEALVAIGPLSIAINAGGLDGYKGGVLTPAGLHHNTCPMFCCYPPGNSYSTLDHEVLLVGYGDDDGQAYWVLPAALQPPAPRRVVQRPPRPN